MERKIRVYSQGWHYLLEGIIISYFVLLWERFSAEHHLSFWSFFLVLIPSVFIFTFISYKDLHWLSYLPVLAGMTFVLYVIEYPIWIAVFFASILTYRYHRGARAENFYKETTLLGVSLGVACFTYYWARNPEIFLILLLQYTLILIGYYLKHIITVEGKQEKRKYIRPLATISLVITGIGLLSTFIYSGLISKIIGGVVRGFLFLTVRTSSSVANYIDDRFEIDELEPEPLTGEDDDGIFSSYLAPSLTEAVEDFVVVYIGLALLVILLLVFMVHRLLKRRSGRKQFEARSETYIRMEEEIPSSYSYDEKRANYRLSRKPENRVRRLVYQFEKQLAKTAYRREPYETIEDWMKRIGSHSGLSVYQQVRYGEKIVDEGEIRQLKLELNHLKKRLKEMDH